MYLPVFSLKKALHLWFKNLVINLALSDLIMIFDIMSLSEVLLQMIMVKAFEYQA